LAILFAVVLLGGCTSGDQPPPTAGPSVSAPAPAPATATPTAPATGRPAGGSDLKVAQDLPVLARVKGTEFGSGLTLDLLGV